MAFPRSGTVDTSTRSGTKDCVLAHMSAAQSSNISAADHLKFDTVDFSRGEAVTLDTTTSYVNTQGAVASIGRFSLRGGRTYMLSGTLPYIAASGATGSVAFVFWNVTGNAQIGQASTTKVATDATNESTGSDLVAMFAAPGGYNDITLVEVQLVAVTALSSIGAANTLPSVFVETI